MADYVDRRSDRRRRSVSQPRDYFLHVGGCPPKQDKEKSRPQGTSCGRSSRRGSVCQPSVPSAEEARRRSVSLGRRGRSVERGKGSDAFDDEYDGYGTTGRRGACDGVSGNTGGRRRQTHGKSATSAGEPAPPSGDKTSRRSAKKHQDLGGTNVTCTVFKFDLGDGASKHGSCPWKPQMATFNKKVFIGAVGVIAKAQGERAAKALWETAPPYNNDELKNLLSRAVLSLRISEGVSITKVASEYARKGSCVAEDEGRCRDKAEIDDYEDWGKRRERGRDTTKRHDGGYPADYPTGKGYGTFRSSRDTGYGI